MKILKTLLFIIFSIIIITLGVNSLSKPSDFAVVLGLLAIVVGLSTVAIFVIAPILKKI